MNYPPILMTEEDREFARLRLKNELAVILGTDPISRAMRCSHEYVATGNGREVICKGCGLETTEDALRS